MWAALLSVRGLPVVPALSACVWITLRLALARVPDLAILFGIFHAGLRQPRQMWHKLCLRPAYTPARQDGGVAKLTKVAVNGVELTVVIRGQAGARPVLFLHGGPGMTELPAFLPRQGPLEDKYLCVHYDQRGSATSGYHAGKLTVALHKQDCISLLEWIKTNLSDKKAVIIGGSWGSMLGMLVAMERPDLICHLVLRGVFVNGAQ